MRKFWRVVFLASCAFSWGRQEEENPEYKAWSTCHAGAWVKHRHVEDSADQLLEQEITGHLIDLAPEKAVLEVEVVRIVHGIRLDLRHDRREIPARVEVDRYPDRVEDRDVREGEEELTIAGEKLKCRWVEVVEIRRSGKSTTKIWSSREVPGEIVQMESRQEENSLVRTTTTLLAWHRE